MVEELEERLKREGKKLDAELSRSSGAMEADDGGEIPFSAKGRDGNAGETTPSAQTKQNSAERTGNVAESTGTDRPEFELATHTKNDLLRRSTIDDQGSRKAKAQAEAKNSADAELGWVTLTSSDRDHP